MSATPRAAAGRLLFGSLRGYRPSWLRADLVAGLSGWAVLVPESPAYAGIAEVDANRELIGLGAANLGSGLCSGMVVNGSLSKTAVNGGAGAKSQVSGLTVAALTTLTLLFLTGPFENLPEATLAAVVITAVVELIDITSLRHLYRLGTSALTTIYGFAARVDFYRSRAVSHQRD